MNAADGTNKKYDMKLDVLPIDLQKELFLKYCDERCIENLRKVCRIYDTFVRAKYKEIAFNIMKNKYDYKIYEYSASQISILYGDGKCHSIIDNIGLLLAFLCEHCD